MTGRWTSQTGSALLTAAVCLAAGFLPVFAGASVHATADYVVHGKVIDKDGKPAAGAVVLAYNLATEELYTVETGPRATFTLDSLPDGYYDFAARLPGGFYVGDQVADISPLHETEIELRLSDYVGDDEAERWHFPGSDDKPTGVAAMVEVTGDGFFAQPYSKYVLGGGGALVLAALGGGGGPPASAFQP